MDTTVVSAAILSDPNTKFLLDALLGKANAIETDKDGDKQLPVSSQEHLLSLSDREHSSHVSQAGQVLSGSGDWSVLQQSGEPEEVMVEEVPSNNGSLQSLHLFTKSLFTGPNEVFCNLKTKSFSK